MTTKEQNEKIVNYLHKAHRLLGFRLEEFECEFQGDRPVIELAYFDYKPSGITRAELQQLMPEAELARVKRRISDTAQLQMIGELLCGGEWDGARAFVRLASGEEISLSDWAVGQLCNDTLDAEDIPYNKLELRDEWISEELDEDAA